jgi:hypothetical protein
MTGNGSLAVPAEAGFSAALRIALPAAMRHWFD